MERSATTAILILALAVAAIFAMLFFVPVKECSSGWGHAELLEPGQTPTPTPVGLDENGCVDVNLIDF